MQNSKVQSLHIRNQDEDSDGPVYSDVDDAPTPPQHRKPLGPTSSLPVFRRDNDVYGDNTEFSRLKTGFEKALFRCFLNRCVLAFQISPRLPIPDFQTRDRQPCFSDESKRKKLYKNKILTWSPVFSDVTCENGGLLRKSFSLDGSFTFCCSLSN